MKFYTDSIPLSTQGVLNKIKSLPEIHDFYLTGGTALSLLIGHRESEDLDFFTNNPFQPMLLQNKIKKIGIPKDIQIEEETLNLFLDNVKLQFLLYPYNLLEEFIIWNNISVSSISDIACTKLITISMRGSKKDFIDLYVILQQKSLKDLFNMLERKYIGVQYNYPHILKSLVYFNDADQQPMPRMHEDIHWEEVKSSIIQHVKAFSF